jgi:hypothetical protein
MLIPTSVPHPGTKEDPMAPPMDANQRPTTLVKAREADFESKN